MPALLVDYENVNGSNKWVMHSPKVSELTVVEAIGSLPFLY